MTLTKQQVTEYRDLQNSGVAVRKHNQIRFNEGSEMVPHTVSKVLVGLLGIRHSYRVDSEVEVKNQSVGNGEIDVLLWGHEGRMTYAVECEHSPTRDTIEMKVEKYVRHTAVDDLQVLNLNHLPADMMDAYGWIGAELGIDS